MTTVALPLLLAYLLGSFPTAYIAGRLRGGVDLRQQGSGNVGATNAGRVLGWRVGIWVLILDVAKGAAAVLLALRLTPATLPADLRALPAACAAILGHVTSPWVGFRGGKGVATAAGAFLVVAPWGALPALLVWTVMLLATHVMSVASIAAAATFPLCLAVHELTLHAGNPAAAWIQRPATLVAALLVAVLLLARHRGNMRRLRTGQEKPLW